MPFNCVPKLEKDKVFWLVMVSWLRVRRSLSERKRPEQDSKKVGMAAASSAGQIRSKKKTVIHVSVLRFLLNESWYAARKEVLRRRSYQACKFLSQRLKQIEIIQLPYLGTDHRSPSVQSSWTGKVISTGVCQLSAFPSRACDLPKDCAHG